MAQQVKVNIKITDEEFKGRYCNMVLMAHTQEEFTLDFVHRVHDKGVVTARVITSPGHIKRLIRALSAHMEVYEKNFGTVAEAQEPPAGPVN